MKIGVLCIVCTHDGQRNSGFGETWTSGTVATCGGEVLAFYGEHYLEICCGNTFRKPLNPTATA